MTILNRLAAVWCIYDYQVWQVSNLVDDATLQWRLRL